ncbi:MAG: dihydroorotate dehydrogenase-like protein [Kiritimatiellae bacterium]|nr:dihydroorotate dehydrogenase-like protein [Kiritimatiellia bacterium]
MTDLRTTYMGIPLSNPIIAGASALTANLATIRALEAGGAAAIVTKSLFEEQIQLEHFKFDEDLERGNYRYAEMITVMPKLEFAGPAQHLRWVREAKRAVSIPVIASLNAVNPDTWIEYARKLEATGVDALECNFFASPKEPDKPAARIEDEQVETVARLKAALRIPFSVKLSFCYTNPLSVIRRMDAAGAAAVVIFNRLMEPDIDTREQKNISPFNISYTTDYRLPLRYAGLLEGGIRADVCCSTGIFDGDTVVKAILAGAQVVQTVSALFREGFGHIRAMTRELERWMSAHGYTTLADFRGKLSRRHVSDPWAYTRAQYARLLMDPDLLARNAEESR